MGFRKPVNLSNGKSAKEKKLDEDRAVCLRLEGEIIARQKKILSRQFIRDADFNQMVAEKALLETDQNELGKLRRSIQRREEQTK